MPEAFTGRAGAPPRPRHAAFGADLPLRLEGGRLAPAGGARLFHLADRYDRDETGDLCRTSLLAWVIRITWEACYTWARQGRRKLSAGPGSSTPKRPPWPRRPPTWPGESTWSSGTPGDIALGCRAVVIDRQRTDADAIKALADALRRQGFENAAASTCQLPHGAKIDPHLLTNSPEGVKIQADRRLLAWKTGR